MTDETRFEGYLGGVNDRVKLVLNGDEVHIAESYQVHQSILQQPSTFSLRLGFGGVIQDFTNKYPPNTKFQLYIGGALRMTGRTDGYVVEQNAGATSLTFEGRDVLAPLHDGFIQVEKPFNDQSYLELVQHALKEVGYAGKVTLSNASNRKLQTAVEFEDGGTQESEQQATQGSTFREVQAKLGERWYHFVKRELDRAGLFVWSTADGNVVLARPNLKQEPRYRILRHRGQPVNEVTVESVIYHNRTTTRYSEALVYGRYGGKKYGRAKAKGHFVDDEMRGLGYTRPFVTHDVNISNEKQAAFLASRKLAEFRRANWTLQYTVAGHSVRSIGNKGEAYWAPDTIVEVQDMELDLFGLYWVESVTFRRPPTTTQIVLMRLEDLLFGLTD